MSQAQANDVSSDAGSSPSDQNVVDLLGDLARDDVAKESITTVNDTTDRASSAATNQKAILKRNRQSSHDAEEDADELEARSSWEISKISARPQKTVRMTGIRPPDLIYPKSQYDDWKPPLSKTREADALNDLRSEAELANAGRRSPSQDVSEGGFISYRLEQFSIYKPGSGKYPDEFAPLHHLCVKPANNNYYFDGILEEGQMRRYVQNVAFKFLSIGNYCDTVQHGVGDQLWIQSTRLERSDVWYQLGNPAPEYRRYHTEFVWLANFAKHFTDFLHRHVDVHIHDFREKFYIELEELHGTDEAFQTWLKEYGDTDFCRVVAAHPEFLYKESVDVERRNDGQPIWREVHPKSLTAVREQKVVEQLTVVTPFVYGCFKHLPWGKFLNPVEPDPRAFKLRRRREQAFHLTADSPVHMTPGQGEIVAHNKVMRNSTPAKNLRSMKSTSRVPETSEMLHEFFDELDPDYEINERQERLTARAEIAKKKFIGVIITASTRIHRDQEGNLLLQRPDSIQVGDVVGIERDQDTVWKGNADLWFAYVQDVRTSARGQSSLKVIWLYAPSDTSCSTMHYPIHNELFFSDHCNCKDSTLPASDVVCKVTVDFFRGPGEGGAEFIVRQKYKIGDAAFVTLKKSDFRCVHYSGNGKSEMEEFKERYHVGDTVLIRKRIGQKEDGLEPVEIVEFRVEGSTQLLLVRRLPRRSRDFPNEKDARPNELVYTDEMFTIPAEKVERRCDIRFYTEDDKAKRRIPAPYNRDGTTDAYYITCRQVDGSLSPRLEPLLEPFPNTLIQGFDPSAPSIRRRLNGMDLYCGGGNFGRGLEEGGAVHNKWAVDYDRDAIHTYHANLKYPQDTALYFGSVNDLLAQAMKGRYTKYVPEPGEVDFISAGSPCQGFSNANQKKSNEKSLRNSSLVASVAAFVDFYRPKYALLENVVAMAAKGKEKQDQNVFSQLLCSLVGMGYQVQQFNLDAWSFGSPQSRSRLFVSIAAPGLRLPPPPSLSHSHPPGTRDRGLGVAANGVAFGLRRFEPTPFDYITAAEGTKDLPYVGDARTNTCIPYPDHRNSRFESYLKRVQISQIPVSPRGQTFMLAYQRGRLGKPQVDVFRWDNRHKVSKLSKSWQRVNPNGLLPTITTSAQPSCSFTGTILHWDQHRLLTIMEARRAQSFPDQDVLIGHPRVQWKIVGNSVARTVSLALGISLRHAWLAMEPDKDDGESFRVRARKSLSPEKRGRASGDVEALFDGGPSRPGFSYIPPLENTAASIGSWERPETGISSSRKRSFQGDEDDMNEMRSTKKGRIQDDDSPPVELSIPFPSSGTSPVPSEEKQRDDSQAWVPFPSSKRGLLTGSTRTSSNRPQMKPIEEKPQNQPSTPTRGEHLAPIFISDDEGESSAGGHAMSISTGGSRKSSRTIESFNTAPGAPMSLSFGSSPHVTPRHNHHRTNPPITTSNRSHPKFTTSPRAPRSTKTTNTTTSVSCHTRTELTMQNMKFTPKSSHQSSSQKPGESELAPIELLD